MTPFRVLQASIALLLLVGGPWLVRAFDAPMAPGDVSSSWVSGAPVLAGVLEDNGDNSDNDGGDNDDGDNDDGDNNDNGGDDNDNGDDGEDNDNDFNDNFDLDLPPPPPAPAAPPEPQCSTPGQETAFTSHDGKVTVRIFPTMPRPVRVEVYQVIDFLAAPLPPGNLVGLLAYEIRASYCDTNPLHELPAEVNLTVHYSDVEATGLDESQFVIGRLDLPARTWVPVEKQANDPATNSVGATITMTGFYMVWEQR